MKDLLKDKLRCLYRAVYFRIEKRLPFRACWVDNNESIGCWTPWSAVNEAEDWKLEMEDYWQGYCGRFEAIALGRVIAVFD